MMSFKLYSNLDRTVARSMISMMKIWIMEMRVSVLVLFQNHSFFGLPFLFQARTEDVEQQAQ